MADSYFEYTNTPTDTSFTFPFRFIALGDVHVLGFNQASSAYTNLDSVATVTANANNQGGTVTFSSGWNSAGLYNTLRIYRATSTTQLVDFENGSRLTATDLDNAYQQSLYVAQEVTEDANTFQFKLQKNLNDTALTNVASFKHTDLTGDGTTTAFNLTFTPATETPEAYLVSIDGAVQAPDAYTIAIDIPSTITFASAPPASAVITVVTLASSSIATTVDNVTLQVNNTSNKISIKDDSVTPAKLDTDNIVYDSGNGNVRIGEAPSGAYIWKDIDLRGVISIGQRGTDSDFGFIHQDPSGSGVCLTGADSRISSSPDLTVTHDGYVILGNVPTSDTGLDTGTIWKDADGFLKIK